MPMYTHMHTYAHICTHMHTYAHICTHMRTYAHVYTHIHTYTHICTHMHTYAQICTHMHTYAQPRKDHPRGKGLSEFAAKHQVGFPTQGSIATSRHISSPHQLSTSSRLISRLATPRHISTHANTCQHPSHLIGLGRWEVHDGVGKGLLRQAGRALPWASHASS